MSIFPRQDIPQSEKTPEWCKKHLDYAESLLNNADNERNKATRLYNSYNGVKSPDSIKWLEATYGVQNRAKFIAYRVGRTKQDLLSGEWLTRPLNATVETVNIQAKSEKMAAMDFMMGAMIAKDELAELKEIAGVDVMEGAPVPESEDDPLWAKMSPKDKQEDIMQIIVNEQIKALKLVKKFGECFLDARITGKCFAKIEINEKGDVDFMKIDPRDFIYEEIEGDDFIEKSPIKGCRMRMPIHEVLRRYELTKEQRDLLYNVQQNPETYIRQSRGMLAKGEGGGVMCTVLHIEWKSVKPSYYKIMPKTPNQLAYDDTTTEIMNEIPYDVYEPNKAKYDKGVEKGHFKIETGWEEDLWEATRIGGLPELDVNMRRKPFQMRSHDAPAYILDSSYVGCLFGTVDGIRIPLQQVIENFDTAFDIGMYQLMKELNRAKGKILAYDLAALPKNTTLKKLMYDAVNDGFITTNSAASGNFSGKNLDLKSMMQEHDLGFSQSFEGILALLDTLLNTLDRLTGINDNRQGQIAASATVTNSQDAIKASRTMTEPLFYQMQLFVENVMTKIVEATKVSWAFYKLDKGEQILGSEKYKYMQVTRELGYRDYGVHINDGGKYNELRSRMRAYIEFGMNTKEISALDALRFEMAETTVEAENIFRESLQRVQQIAQESAQADREAQMQMQQQQLQTNLQIAQEDREDRQNQASNDIMLKGKVQMEVDDNKAKNKVIEQNHKMSNDMLSE
jgi:hypothetical protein